MKVPFLHKVLILAMFGGLVLIGCGGGGDDSGGGECLAGSSYCPGSSGGGEDPGGGDPGGNNNTTTGPGGPTPPAENITAHLNFEDLDNNITENTGMFNIINNQLNPDDIDKYSNLYIKAVRYHNIPGGIATKIVPFLFGGTYTFIGCTYEDSPTFCQEYERGGTYLPIGVHAQGVRVAHITLNPAEAKRCSATIEDENNTMECDVEVLLFLDPAKFNNTSPVPRPLFKDTFIEANQEDGNTYAYAAELISALNEIESVAQSVSLRTETQWRDVNLSTYAYANYTLRAFVNLLDHNNEGQGANLGYPQLGFDTPGTEFDYASLLDEGAFYELDNRYNPFLSKPVEYNVSENGTGENAHLYNNLNGANPDYLSMKTLCQRTKNWTAPDYTASPPTPAELPVYTCEEGAGNISSRWKILGKDIIMGW